jgi:hypothetical protein
MLVEKLDTGIRHHAWEMPVEIWVLANDNPGDLSVSLLTTSHTLKQLPEPLLQQL